MVRWLGGALLWLAMTAAGADDCAAYRFPAAADADAAPDATGFLFEARPPDGGSPNYILGTLHSAAPEVSARWRRVALLLASRAVRVFITERDLERSSTAELPRLPIGRTLPERLADAPGLYAQVEDQLQRYGLPVDAARLWPAWFVAALLSQAPAQRSDNPILDAFLLQTARALNLEIRFLETFADIVAGYQGHFSAAEQTRLLWEAVCNQALLAEQAHDQVRAYAADDAAAWWRVLQGHEGSDPQLSNKVQSVFVDRRNAAFWRQIEPELQRGSAFVAIGALHVLGDGGLLDRLRAAGWSVRFVEPAALPPVLGAHETRALAEWAAAWLADAGLATTPVQFQDLRIETESLPALRKRLCPGRSCTVETTSLPEKRRILFEDAWFARLLASPATPAYVMTGKQLVPVAADDRPPQPYAESLLVRELVRQALYRSHGEAWRTRLRDHPRAEPCLRNAVLYRASLAQQAYLRDRGSAAQAHLFTRDPRCPDLN